MDTISSQFTDLKMCDKSVPKPAEHKAVDKVEFNLITDW